MAEFTSIITHNDFDGLGSAALLSWAYDIERILFAGPITIDKAELPITTSDIVCDLPYPLQCGMWFDHHAGNAAVLALRGIDLKTLPGRFAPAPSCVRVVYDFLVEQAFGDIPEDYRVLADAADVIDSFSFPSIEAWRADTPANRIDRALKASSPSRRDHEQFLRDVVFLLRDASLEEVADEPAIRERSQAYAREEEVMLTQLRKYGGTLPDDPSAELFVIDTTSFMNPVRLDKKLIGLIAPQARCYVELKPVFRDGRKSNDVSVSISLSLAMAQLSHRKDVGEIMRELNIGDGHAGAAAGVWRCASPHEFQKVRDELPRRILELWRQQGS